MQGVTDQIRPVSSSSREGRYRFKWSSTRPLDRVPRTGLEPARLSTLDLESSAPTSYATGARSRVYGLWRVARRPPATHASTRLASPCLALSCQARPRLARPYSARPRALPGGVSSPTGDLCSLPCRAMPRQAQPSHAMRSRRGSRTLPGTSYPCLAEPCPAKPYLARPGPAPPHLALPCAPGGGATLLRDVLLQATPGPALPCQGSPGLAVPCLAVRSPGRSRTDRGTLAPATPRLAMPCQAGTRHATPSPT